MRAFTLRSAERQVELQEDPNEHPTANQIRSFTAGNLNTRTVLKIYTFLSELEFCKQRADQSKM